MWQKNMKYGAYALLALAIGLGACSPNTNPTSGAPPPAAAGAVQPPRLQATATPGRYHDGKYKVDCIAAVATNPAQPAGGCTMGCAPADAGIDKYCAVGIGEFWSSLADGKEKRYGTTVDKAGCAHMYSLLPMAPQPPSTLPVYDCGDPTKVYAAYWPGRLAYEATPMPGYDTPQL